MQAGAIFIDDEAEKYLRTVLTNAGLSEEDVKEYTKGAVKDFESFAKRTFHDEGASYYIQIPHTNMTNSSIRVRRGRMTVEG